MVWAATTFKYTFDYHADDVYFCTADIGWVTGHSYVAYGPLLNCAKRRGSFDHTPAQLTHPSVMFEGIPTHPDAARSWQIVQKHKVTQFYTGLVLLLSSCNAVMNIQRPRRSGRCSALGICTQTRATCRPSASWAPSVSPSTRRPGSGLLNPALALSLCSAMPCRYYNTVGKGRCSVVDTWWQTETGGHMLTPLPGATPQKPGSAVCPVHASSHCVHVACQTLPMFGVVPAILDENGVELQGACEGFLVIKQSWPGQVQAVH